MSKPKFASDLDDFIFPFDVPYQKWVAEEFDVAIPKPIGTSYRYKERYIGKIAELLSANIDRFVDNASLEWLKPDPQAVAAMGSIAVHPEIHIVTSRAPHRREITEELIKIHPEIEVFIEEVHFPTELGMDPVLTDKGKYVAHLGAYALGDDADHNVNSAQLNCVQGILLNNKANIWNNQAVFNGVLRAKSLCEVAEIAGKFNDQH